MKYYCYYFEKIFVVLKHCMHFYNLIKTKKWKKNSWRTSTENTFWVLIRRSDNNKVRKLTNIMVIIVKTKGGIGHNYNNRLTNKQEQKKKK